MPTNFETLNTKIKAKLQGITKIAVVYDYPIDFAKASEIITGYPCAIFIPTENDADYHDSITNIRNYVFSIYLIVERKTVDYETAHNAMRNLVDDVINAFDDDYSLTGSCSMTNAAPSKWGYLPGLDDALMAEVILRCKVLYTIT